jgi:hypothetical protein
MTHDAPDRIDRLETAIFGDGGSNPGVLAKLGRIEAEFAHTNRTLESINAHIARGLWILVTAILVAILSLIIRVPTAAPGNSASISVGATESVADSARDYLTVAEVATRESKAERTIIEWIETGRIDPAPTKPAKEWVIAANYRILPQLSANSRTPAEPP